MKGLNIKALFINHLEKIGFGVIVLAVVLIWSKEYFGGAWALEQRNPTLLVENIKQKRAEIENGKWPEEKRKEFALVDFSQRAATLLRPIDSSKYELLTELFVPLNRPKEKAREPEFLAVESLDAREGYAILAKKAANEVPAGEEGPRSGPRDDETTDEEDDAFRRLDGDAGLDETMDEAAPGDKRGIPARGKNVALGAGPAGLGAAAGPAAAMPKGMLDGMGDMGGAGAVSGYQPEGRFYVAVRGVWPLRQQLERIQKALHLPTTSAALEKLSILDFELERQTAVAGDDPWSEEWEKLDIEYSNQILDELAGFADDSVAMEVFDTAITSPLPMRMFGLWGSHATHPRIKKYDLSPQEQEREKALQTRLMEEFEKLQLDTEKSRGPVKRGFNRQSNDFRQMGDSMLRNNPMAAGEAFQQMAKDMRGAGSGNGRPLTPADLTSQITAAGRLLLFRYFDFNVKPGYAYRYRVKLRLMNPNYQREPAEVEDPAYAEGENRLTPESNVSNVAVLQSSPAYFLKHVERHPLVEEGRRTREVVQMNIYERHKQMGTQVYATVPLTSLGQFLGGKQNTDVLDVAAPSFGKDDYTFTTDDVLLDVATGASLVPENHPDLILPPKGKGAKTVSVGVTPEALVISGTGTLKVLAATGLTAREKTLRQNAEKERRPFEDLEPKADEGASPLDYSPLAGKGAPDPKDKRRGAKGAAGMPGMPGMPGASDPNPRRKGGAGRGAGAAAGAGAMPAAGAMPGIGAGKAKGKR